VHQQHYLIVPKTKLHHQYNMSQDDNTQWFYNRCSTARTTMQTPLSTLNLSIKLLQYIKSLDEDTEEISQMDLFNVLKGRDIQAKERDLSVSCC